MVRKQLRQKRAQRKQEKLLRLKEGFWKRLLRALPVLLLTMLLTFVLVRRDELHEFAADSQDLLMRLSATPKESQVTVVMIADGDYERDFKKDGALNPAKLHQLIGAIAKANPKVIGVDIKTSDQRYRDFQIPEVAPPVVWVREVYEPITGVPVPLDVLGGKDPRLNEAPHSGLPFLYEVNNVVRLYQRVIETTEGNKLSFPWAVFKRFDPKAGEQRQANADHLIIGYAGAPSEELSASQILRIADEPHWSNNDKIRDKIVLIGVSYQAQDLHQTPLGAQQGAFNMAAVIETELSGGGIKQPDEFTFLPLWLLQGVGLVILFQYFPLHQALWRNLALSLALVVGSAVICSLIASLFASRSISYLSLVYLAYFLPVGIFVFIEQLRDLLNDWRKEKLAHVYAQVSTGPSTSEKGDG